ncbi:caspase family protein [Gracilimonas sp. BCB1]|uniref:caspase family protein n=1 Tax=Gracilimonas sp. BCB1 TaxID=3152362 RepID=UPI0032D8CE7B
MGIKKSSFIYIVLIAMVLFQGCSSTSWIVVDEEALDINDYELVKSRYYLESTNGISPNQPLIHFDLKSINTYEYAERVKTERYIQRYRPRIGYVLLGAAGAGLSYYAAFSDQLLDRPTDEQRYALMGAGTLLTGLSFMNMKPVGEPTRTGESRLLRQTGTATEVDTTDARPYNTENPGIRISYNNRVLVENEEWDFNGGRISINLAEEVDAGIFGESPAQNIVVEAFYDSLSQTKEISVPSVFEQFVVVDVQITALRNEPESNPGNILTDLAEGSQLKLVSKEGDWYKVLYGISETWVSANDVRTIWRPSEFASDLSVIAIPNVPFGSIDVERNIPVLGRSSLNSGAFILSNNQYEGELSERIYGQRDAKLMEEYFIQGFGVRSTRVFKAMNATSDLMVNRAYSRLAATLSDSRHNLNVYINGYAEIIDGQVYLLGSELDQDGELQLIDLQKLFRAFNNLDLNSIKVFADLDILNENGSTQALANLASIITDQNFASAVFFASRPDQRSGIYSSTNGKQNRHSIFTYYLAEAIKQRNMNMNSIFNHLERNVPFTSRSLYERPQNPLFFGNRELELLN